MSDFLQQESKSSSSTSWGYLDTWARALLWRLRGVPLGDRDRWQVTPKLTPSTECARSPISLMTPASGGIERYDQATNQVFLGGYGSQRQKVGITTGKKLFAPRLGIAYRVTRDRPLQTLKTV